MMVNKACILGGFLISLSLVTAGCTVDNHFTQEPAEDTSLDITSAATSGSTGAGGAAPVVTTAVGGGGNSSGGIGGVVASPGSATIAP